MIVLYENFNFFLWRCFVYILVGSTQAITIGPTAIMAIMTLSYAQGKPPEYAVLLCFVTGVITLLMGLLQLGKEFAYFDLSAC